MPKSAKTNLSSDAQWTWSSVWIEGSRFCRCIHFSLRWHIGNTVPPNSSLSRTSLAVYARLSLSIFQRERCSLQLNRTDHGMSMAHGFWTTRTWTREGSNSVLDLGHAESTATHLESSNIKRTRCILLSISALDLIDSVGSHHVCISSYEIGNQNPLCHCAQEGCWNSTNHSTQIIMNFVMFTPEFPDES